MTLFAELTASDGVVGTVIAVATAVFGYLKTRENRRLRQIETRSKNSEMERGELTLKVESQAKQLESQEKDIAALKKEVTDCHAQRDTQDATINRLEEWRIETLQKQNDLYRRVAELEAELDKHRPPGRHRK